MTDKHATIQPDRDQPATQIHVIDKAGLADFLKGLPGFARSALAAQKFSAGPFEHAIIPDGEDWSVVTGVADASGLGEF